MNHHKISGTSEALSDADTRKRDLALQILRTSNDPVLGFAKLMVPTALSAVGAMVALAQAGGRLAAVGTPRFLILAGCTLTLISMVSFALTVYARPVRISVEDYDHVFDELLKTASSRTRMATVGLCLLALGVALAVLGFVV